MMSMLPFRLLLPVLAVLGVVAAGCGLSGEERSENFSAAFVYVGPVDDYGWTYAHDQGRLALEQELGIGTVYAESVPIGDEADEVLRGFAQQHDVVYVTSEAYTDSVVRVAREFPRVAFAQATGVQRARNLGTYDGRIYQAWYLAGMAAGGMSESGQLGYIAPLPIPEMVRDLNAFTLGARAVNPDAQVHVQWIFTFFDPDKEREAALALVAAGVDVIARESDSTAADQVAAAEGLYVVAYNAVTDQNPREALLTAPVWNWGVIYEQMTRQLLEGAWTSRPLWWGIETGLFDIAPLHEDVPEDLRLRIEEAKRQMASGELDPFAGPLTDNSGTLRVPEGERVSDEELLSLDWLVEGVLGDIPASEGQ